MKRNVLLLAITIIFGMSVVNCTSQSNTQTKRLARYLFPKDFMADPSAHVFNDRLYIYPSHDRRTGVTSNAHGEAFLMIDYHVFSLDDVENGEVTDHGVILDLKDIPWATNQLWAPDVAHKDGKYYLYFPARDKNNVFRIGAAIADRPEGPFVPQPEPIRGSYSIDPCVFEEDGEYYMYFGGIGKFPKEIKSSAPWVVKLSQDMLEFAEEPRGVVIMDGKGRKISENDNSRHFFEAAWMHKYNGKYYFSYSTGDSHYLCYAIGDNPYGPFTYQGIILTPVIGWTTHHSIVEFKGKWYLFYHDSKPSGGVDWLRSIKVTELHYNPDGTIQRISGGIR
ncbi:MAG: glycoside hydrolase family 43 protein [Treponema sp.]|jgi:beta-xylosidase|nr:glycoside hydrolase family 43 protein [Treponema sp.]